MVIVVIVFLTSLLATFLSSMSGGGSGLIAIPVWLLLGMSYPTAMSIQIACSVFWVLPASYNYLHDRHVDWKFLCLFGLIGMGGALIGAMTVVNLDAKFIHAVIGAIILILVAWTLRKKDLGLHEKRIASRWQRLSAYPFAVLLGFYEIIFGAGNAVAFSLLTFWTRGFDFMDALGNYYAVAFLWSLLGLILLTLKGFFVASIAIPAVIGALIGGFMGSRLARYKGNTFIKTGFIVIGGVLGLKLLLGY